MKSLSLVAQGKLKLIEKKMPRLRGNKSLVKLRNVGVCSSDIHRSFGGGAYFYPLVMGHEATGVIEKSSSGEYRKGQQVVIFPLKPCFKCKNCKRESFQTCSDYGYYGSREDGAYQEYLAVNNWNLLKIPKKIHSEDAALTEPTAIMVHVKNILIAELGKEEVMTASGAIIGGGFLSMILAKLLIFKGLKNLSIFDRNKFKINFAKARQISVKHSRELDKATNLNQYDWVVEASGDPESVKKSIEICKPGGLIILMSNISTEVKIPANIFSSILRKEITIKGSWNSSFSHIQKNDWKETIRLFKDGFKPSDFISHRVELKDVPETLKRFHLHKTRKKQFQAVKALIKF